MFQALSRFTCWLLSGAALLAACASAPAGQPSGPSPALVQPAPDPGVVRLATGEWPPYNGIDLPHGGCDSWVIQEAFALEGLGVEFGFFPWVRAYSLSESGTWDGTPSWDDSPEHRVQHFLSAEPVSLQEWVFFYRADRPFEWDSLDDLEGKIMGVTTGYIYSGAFDDLRKKNSVTFVENPGDEANFRMLLAGRIDVFPMERRVGRRLVKTIFSPEEQAQILDSPRSFAQFHSYLLLSRAVEENEQRMAVFDRGFQRLQASGRYAEIEQSCVD